MGVFVRLLFSLALSLVFLGGCANADIQPSAIEPEVHEYNLSENRYAITVSLGRGVKNMHQAKKIAYRKAAELTVKKKSRYFIVISEAKVSVIDSERQHKALPETPSTPPPARGNFFDKDVRQEDSAGEPLINPPTPRGNFFDIDVRQEGSGEEPAKSTPRAGKESLGYKVTFEIYKAKSFGRRYIDACDLTKCP